MTNAPASRRTHVVRLVGTNKNGDVLQDIWVDVERFEVAKSASKTSQGFWQAVQRLLRWFDDPDADGYREEGTPSRDTEIVKICSPDESDVNDPDQWVPVRVNKSIKSRGGSASDQNYQDRQKNDETVQSRKVTVRRIVHYDTNIDDKAQAAFDNDPTRKAYVVRGSDYTRDESTKDADQYVEHEIIEFFKPRTNERDNIAGQVNQDAQVKLLNQYQIDESDDPDGKVTGNNGINPPYRLDPWQNIINVKLTPEVIVVFLNDGLGALSLNLLATDPATGKKVTVNETKDFTFVTGVLHFAGTAYRVSATIGSFVKTNLFALTDPTPGLPSAFVYVFAVSGNKDDDMKRAIDGAKAIANAPDVVTGDELGPPGLLWSVKVFQFPFGASLTWKLRYGKHRNDKEKNNAIVQCYPLGVVPSNIDLGDPINPQHLTYHGYSLNCYRTDSKGTGTLYGSRAHDVGASAIDPAWYQKIETIFTPAPNPDVPATTVFNFGIPFQDPPPLIRIDKE